MTEREKLIEAMARAMARAYTRDRGRRPTPRDVEVARDTLAAIEAHGGGCRVVPVKRTVSMAAARKMADMATEWDAQIAASPYAPQQEATDGD